MMHFSISTVGSNFGSNFVNFKTETGFNPFQFLRKHLMAFCDHS